jgi:hypothetical protein
MDVPMHANERTQELRRVWSLLEAGTPNAHYLVGDARPATDDRLALFATNAPWRERAELLDRRAELVAEALQGSGDA